MGEKIKAALKLYCYFFKIGWFTFGGGWSIISQMQKDFIEEKHEMEEADLLTIVSVGRSLPGLMVGNVAYLFGYHRDGVLSGVLAVLGIITPALFIMSVITIVYNQVRMNIWVSYALEGVRSCVAPIIFSAVVRLRKGAFPEKICYGLCISSIILSVFFEFRCVSLILLGVLAGILLNEGEER